MIRVPSSPISWRRNRRLPILDSALVRILLFSAVAVLVILLYRSPPVDLSTSLKMTTHYTTSKIMSFSSGAGFPSFGAGDPEPQTLSHLQPITMVMFMFGLDTAVEGTVALKSVLMYISRPLELHIICGPDVPPIVSSRLNLISRPAYDIKVTYIVMTNEKLQARVQRAGIGTTYQAGLGALVKVFMHELLPDVKRAIYFDTDMAFMVDPLLLWQEFDRLTADQMIALPTQVTDPDAYHVCTCVMLVDLEAMRRTVFMPSTLFPTAVQTLGSSETWDFAGVDPIDPVLGDQGLYWAVRKRYPEYFARLGFSWDVTHCRYSWGLSLADGDDSMTEEVQIERQSETELGLQPFEQLFPGILHFNCQGSTAIVWDDYDNLRRPRWAPFIHIMKEYKWVWFNRGDGTATISMTVVEDRDFFDEIQFSQSSGGRHINQHSGPHGHDH